MEYVLKTKCKCGGIVVVMPCKEVNGLTEEFVSHGICIECLTNICLPAELYWPFVRKYCYAKEM